MKRTGLFLALCTVIANSALAWGGKGHDIIASIAQQHLSPKASSEIERVLGGRSMVYYSSWMDNIRDMEEYSHTTTWHYANVDDGESYETMQKEPMGDVITATELTINALKDPNLSDSLRTMYTKFLIHLIGDMHCPMHAGHLSDLGGNRYPVTFMGNQTNLHALWDSHLIEAAKSWSYSEWRENIDIGYEPEFIASIASGSPYEWFTETVENAKVIYDNTPQDENLSYGYITMFYPMLESQFYKSGIRLAATLNEIYR
jgi:hypothetical protein